ncbi:hypothetical protein GCM10023171_28700 [Microbacterium panaciterrae]|uniref:TfoX N-terminal domain-containing protein n=2 Tax=Microbacterium panaciterrae TaxID=985759 RepID=A0ABP8PN98_9MICO
MDVEMTELADRIRALLEGDLAIEERRMFGSRAFLVDGKILVGARRGGSLLVRVEIEHGAGLLGRPGVTHAVMGARTMSANWLDVAAEAVADDERLIFWLDVAREDAAGRS